MQQPNPLQDNNNEPVANALLYDLSSIAEIGEPKSAEDYLYQQAATLAIAIKAYMLKTDDIREVLPHLEQDIKERKQLGLIKYGVELKPFNGRNTVLDMYEEALDLTFYSKCNVMEKLNAANP